MSPEPPPASAMLSAYAGDVVRAVQSVMLPSMQMTLAQAITVSVCAPDVPPPGVVLKTVMLCVPAAVRSVAGMAAVSSVALTNVVARAVAAQLMTELALKFEPFTVSVKAPSPAVRVVGEMLVVVGTGFALTVNVRDGV